MEVADGVNKAGWRPVLVFLPAFFLVFLVPSLYGVLGLDTIVEVSGGLITYTLFNTWFGILLTVGVVAVWYGGLDLEDLGVIPSKLPVAVGITIGCWLLYALAQIVGGLMVVTVALHSTWTDPGVTATIGKAIGFFFGNAPFEELAFRGFLLVRGCHTTVRIRHLRYFSTDQYRGSGECVL
jgi:membrane protease YdiL (CAAX protease family)